MCGPQELDYWIDWFLPLRTSSTSQGGRLVAVILRGGIRIPQQSRTRYVWSNFYARAPAALAKRFATNWPSAFSVRITFTERLSTHRRPIAFQAGRRADLLLRWHAV